MMVKYKFNQCKSLQNTIFTKINIYIYTIKTFKMVFYW